MFENDVICLGGMFYTSYSYIIIRVVLLALLFDSVTLRKWMNNTWRYYEMHFYRTFLTWYSSSFLVWTNIIHNIYVLNILSLTRIIRYKESFRFGSTWKFWFESLCLYKFSYIKSYSYINEKFIDYKLTLLFWH